MAEERATEAAYLQCQDCGQVSEAPQERCPNCGGTKLFEQRAELAGRSNVGLPGASAGIVSQEGTEAADAGRNLTSERTEDGAAERSDSEVREDVVATQDEERYGGPIA